MSRISDPIEIKRWLADGAEIAFLDVRESGAFGEGHPFLAVPAPYSRLEIDVPSLVPRKTTRIVLIDGGDGVAERSAAALQRLGYADIAISRGGVGGWQRAGFVLFKGVNLPSKTFGELVEQVFETPHLSAAELAARRAAGEDVVVLDGRPLTEFQKMSIPGAICCPNGELALRIKDLVPDPATTVVVNCAGRTRSIIGAQTLIDIGLPNPVYALLNGTQGWYLQGLPLDHGRRTTYPDANSVPTQDVLARAKALADAHGVVRVDRPTLDAWAAEADRTTYFLDVRSPEESKANPIAGAKAAPGGQLIQATDQYVGTRGARLAIVDTDGVRGPVVATWLRRLGHEAYLVAPADVRAADAHPAVVLLPEIAPEAFLADGNSARLIDLRSSASYRASHIDGAEWSIRPLLTKSGNRTIVFVTDDPAVAALAAFDAGVPALRLAGGVEDWKRAGLKLVSTPELPPDRDRIDYLFFVHDRHDGNKAAAREYLAWETGLIAQLDADERNLFHLPQTLDAKASDAVRQNMRATIEI